MSKTTDSNQDKKRENERYRYRENEICTEFYIKVGSYEYYTTFNLLNHIENLTNLNLLWRPLVDHNAASLTQRKLFNF